MNCQLLTSALRMSIPSMDVTTERRSSPRDGPTAGPSRVSCHGKPLRNLGRFIRDRFNHDEEALKRSWEEPPSHRPRDYSHGLYGCQARRRLADSRQREGDLEGGGLLVECSTGALGQ